MKRLFIFALLFVVLVFIPTSTGTVASQPVRRQSTTSQPKHCPPGYHCPQQGYQVPKPHHNVQHPKPQPAVHYPKPQQNTHHPKPQPQIHHPNVNYNSKPHYPSHPNPNVHHPHPAPQGPSHHSNYPRPQQNVHHPIHHTPIPSPGPQLHHPPHYPHSGPQIHHPNGLRPDYIHNPHTPKPDIHNLHPHGPRPDMHHLNGPRPDIHHQNGPRPDIHHQNGPKPDIHHPHDQKPDLHHPKPDEHHPKPEDQKPKADNHNPKANDKPKANDSNSGPNAGPSSGPSPQPDANSGPQTQPDNQPPQQQDSANGSPCKVPATRQGIVAAAMWAAKSGKYINYSQGGSRWSGITKKTCPYQGVPAVTDCSAFVTWLYWSAFGNGKDFLNNQGWKAGYTGSMGSNGTPVSLAQAKPGDVVLYGSHPYHHATLYVGNNQVVSFGANGPAKLLPINYRGDYHVRSYLP